MRIGIPAINRSDLLLNCVRSIDHPVERLLVVATKWGDKLEPSVEQALDEILSDHPDCIENVEVQELSGNLGCAGSFNYLIQQLGPSIIACNDTRFGADALGRCLSFIRERPQNPIHCLFSMCIFNVSPLFINEIGSFDENLWPWGWDDIDVGYRIRKKGLEKAIFTKEMGTLFHDHPTQSIYSAPDNLRKWMQQISARNTEYGMKKWGIKEEHFFMLNKGNKWAIDPNVISDAGNSWTLDLETRERRIALLKEQVGIETALTYCMSEGREGCLR